MARVRIEIDDIEKLVAALSGDCDDLVVVMVRFGEAAQTTADQVEQFVTAAASATARPSVCKTKPKAEKLPEEASAERGTAMDELAEKIKKALASGPKLSADLVKITGAKAGDIYYRLDKMRKAGVVETKAVEGSPFRLNHLVQR